MTDAFLFRLLVTQAWQIAVLTVIVAVAAKFLASRRPQLAHWLWLIVVLKCVTPPVWGHQLGLFSHLQSLMPAVADTDVTTASLEEVSWSVVDAEHMSSEIAVSVGHGFPAGPSVFSQSPSESFGQVEIGSPAFVSSSTGYKFVWLVLGIGILASVVLLTFRFISCLRRIRQHRVTEFDREIGSLVADLSKKLKLRRVPRVIVSDVRFGPAVLGVFRHLIVLPRCLVADETRRTEQSLRPILAHELVHIHRGDLLTGTLQAAVQCLWWFHPAVWFANRLLSRETERCCDEQVVAELNCSPVEYARSLLSVIECKQDLKPVPVFPGMKPVEITSQRMERIMSLKQGSRTRMSWWSVLAAMLFAGVMLPGAVVGQQADVPAEVEAKDVQANQTPEPKLVPPDEFLGDTVVALVNGKKVLVDDLIRSLWIALDANPELSAAQRDQILPVQLKSRLDAYIEQEIVLQAYDSFLPEGRKSLIEESLEEPFQELVARIKVDRHVETDKQLDVSLAQEGLSIDLLRQSFVRVQKVQGYIALLADPGLATEQRIAKRKEVLDDLRAEATVVTIFDGDANTEKQATNSHADENAMVTNQRGSVAGDSMVGKGIEGEAGVEGSLVSDEPQQITVLGAVNKPGVVRVPSDVPLKFLDAIAEAGGFNEHVDDTVVLRRDMSPGETSVMLLSIRKAKSDSGANRTLRAGDVLVVEATGPPSPPSIAEKMQVALATPVSIACKDEPVKDVLRKLATKGGFGIVLDIGSGFPVNPMLDRRINLEVDDEPLLIAFDKLCGELGLEYEVRHQLIHIGQRKRVSFVSRIYSVPDLVVPVSDTVPSADGAEPQQADFTGLVELIRTTIEPGTWGDYGGKIAPNENTLSLIIRQTDNVHERIVDLLNQLRELQDIQVTTNFTVVQFKTPEQQRWLEENVTFQNRPGRSPWALLPLGSDASEQSPWYENGIKLSAPKITTFVGQEATVEISGVPDGQFQFLTAATPLAGDRLLRLTYAVARHAAGQRQLKQRRVTQVVGNGQTLLLDVTDTAKPLESFASDSSMSESDRLAAERAAAERIKLADRIRGRVIVAITPKVTRKPAEEELIFGSPNSPSFILRSLRHD